MIKAIRNRIVAGLFIVIPLGVTFWLAYFIYAKMTAWAVELMHSITNFDNFWFVQIIRLFSLLFMIFVLFVIGQLGSYKVGQIFISLAEWFVERLPLINTIYSTIRQIGEALWSPQGGMFRQVVLFEYPRKDLWVIGFLTNENKRAFEINDKTDEELISVFLPTTPNPTSGFLLFVPRKDCKFLKMSVAEGMRLVISGGAVSAASDTHYPLNNDTLQEPESELGEAK
jgi:uncharacterized membrane protein